MSDDPGLKEVNARMDRTEAVVKDSQSAACVAIAALLFDPSIDKAAFKSRFLVMAGLFLAGREPSEAFSEMYFTITRCADVTPETLTLHQQRKEK